MKKPPLVLRLPPSLLRHFNLACFIARNPRWSWGEGQLVLSQFDLTRPERRFALRILRERSNYWLFRSNQERACADFALVDMSSRDPTTRSLAFVELKAHGPLREVSAGHPQFKACDRAAAEIARILGLPARRPPARRLIGNEAALLRWTGHRGRWRSPTRREGALITGSAG